MDHVVHFEIPADNEDRAQQFYETVFDWKVMRSPIPNWDYRTVNTVETDERGTPLSAGAINGGIMKRGDTSPQPVVVIKVANLEDSLKKAVAAGAKVVMEARPVGEIGTYARITDTEGNIIGVWQDL
ncbi:MAG TPA: VOC family protein [Candidatus Methylomirabilis sp.]|nr:VOC family protein [Candidatus Methylomirabilis sp.]